MPQIANPKSDHKSDNRIVLVERMPSGTSRSSNIIRRTALDSILELHIGIGTGSELLCQAAVRTLGGFYFGSPAASFSARDIKEVAQAQILPSVFESYALGTSRGA